MPDSDRKKIKDQEKGVFKTAAGITDPAGAVGELHEETFIFDVPADAAVAEIGIPILKACKLKSVKGLAITGLAVSGSAYVTQTISKRDGAGGGAVIAATFNTNTAGQNLPIVAFVPYNFTLSTTAANLLFPAGSVLTFLSAETSTPVTPIGKIAVTVEYGVV